MRRFVDGRFEKAGKAGRFGTGGSTSRTGRDVAQVGRVGRVGQVGRVGGRSERAFVRCLSFANSSLIVRLTFGERLCDLEVSEERKERFRKERKFTKEMKVLVIKYICEEQWSVEQIVGYCRKNGIPIFFAHPYSSWEQGLSEHTNGLVRQYIPKNTDFKDITDKEIREYQYKINNRPRKVLDFEKPKDLFYLKVI